MTTSAPQRIRFHEVPAFAWITACAFTPASFPLWGRYSLAVLTWPVIALFPLALGLKSIYRTDDFSGVVIMHRKEGTRACAAIRVALIGLGLFALLSLPLVFNAPLWVFALYAYAPILTVVVASYLLAGLLVIVVSARVDRRGETVSRLAPRGTEKVETDGPVYVVAGVAKKITGDSGVGVAFRLVRSLIEDLPEGSYVLVQPRTGSLRAIYERQGFVPSGRRNMILRVPHPGSSERG